MTHSKQIDIITKFIIYFTVFILGAILFSDFNGCDKKPIANNYSHLDSIIVKKQAAIDSVININDSLKSIKKPLLTKYVTVKQKVLVNVHDTVSVFEYVNLCDSVINISEVIIKNDSSVIVAKDIIIANKDLIIVGKDSEIADTKKQLRKQKRKNIFVGIVGILTTSAVIYLGIK